MYREMMKELDGTYILLGRIQIRSNVEPPNIAEMLIIMKERRGIFPNLSTFNPSKLST